MSLLGNLKSLSFAHGSDIYEVADVWDETVTGNMGLNIPAWSGDYEYYGFLNLVGGWIIQRHQISSGQYRYIQGLQDYAANWIAAIAGGLTYAPYNTLGVTNP